MKKKFNIIIACSDEQNDLYNLNLRSWYHDEEGNRVNDKPVLKSGLTEEQAWEEVESFKNTLTNG